MLRLCDLADQWTYDATGEAQPAWTQWRAFADQLTLRPYLTAAAIAPAPAPSSSEFVDNLLAGTAEKLADDTGIRRPSWTLRIPPLRTPWRALGTPRMRADHATRTPPQFAARNITLPATSIWRDREMALAWPNPSHSAARRSGSSSPRSAANSTEPADNTPSSSSVERYRPATIYARQPWMLTRCAGSTTSFERPYGLWLLATDLLGIG